MYIINYNSNIKIINFKKENFNINEFSENWKIIYPDKTLEYETINTDEPFFYKFNGKPYTTELINELKNLSETINNISNKYLNTKKCSSPINFPVPHFPTNTRIFKDIENKHIENKDNVKDNFTSSSLEPYEKDNKDINDISNIGKDLLESIEKTYNIYYDKKEFKSFILEKNINTKWFDEIEFICEKKLTEESFNRFKNIFDEALFSTQEQLYDFIENNNKTYYHLKQIIMERFSNNENEYKTLQNVIELLGLDDNEFNKKAVNRILSNMFGKDEKTNKFRIKYELKNNARELLTKLKDKTGPIPVDDFDTKFNEQLKYFQEFKDSQEKETI